MVSWWFSLGAIICMDDCWLKLLKDIASVMADIISTFVDFMKAILKGDFAI